MTTDKPKKESVKGKKVSKPPVKAVDPVIQSGKDMEVKPTGDKAKPTTV